MVEKKYGLIGNGGRPETTATGILGGLSNGSGGSRRKKEKEKEILHEHFGIPM